MSTSKFEKDVEDDNDEALLRTTASSDNPDDEIVSITTGAHMTEDLLSTPRASPIETFRSQHEIRQLIETNTITHW